MERCCRQSQWHRHQQRQRRLSCLRCYWAELVCVPAPLLYPLGTDDVVAVVQYGMMVSARRCVVAAARQCGGVAAAGQYSVMVATRRYNETAANEQ